MAPREYVYARRVWDRSDGGTYIVSRGCDAPPGAELQGQGRRVHRLRDYVSCMLVRSARAEDGSPMRGPDGAPCAEVVTAYFEDPGLPAVMAGVAIRKGLWGCIQRHEAALREYAAARRAARRGGGPMAGEGGAAAAGDEGGAVHRPGHADGNAGDDDGPSGLLLLQREEEEDARLEAGLLEAALARRAGSRRGGVLVRSGGAALRRTTRALRPLVALPAHAAARHRVVLALAFRLVATAVTAAAQQQ